MALGRTRQGSLLSRGSWALAAAEREIAAEVKLRGRVTALLRSDSSGLIKLVMGVYALLVVACVALRNAEIEFWPSFSPQNSEQTLGVAWQVQTALVALGLPFLLLLIQFARDEGVAALRSSEVLYRETHVRFAIEVSASGLVAASALAAWLSSDGTLAITILAITTPTVLLLVHAYLRALALLLDRDKLRQKSGELLREKLSSSMRELWITTRANELVRSALVPLGFEYHPLGLEPDDERWWPLVAANSGRIADIRIDALVGVIAQLPRAGPGASSKIGAPTPEMGAAQTDPAGRIVRLCGDSVTEGEPILLLRREAFAVGSDPGIPLDGIVRIDDD